VSLSIQFHVAVFGHAFISRSFIIVGGFSNLWINLATISHIVGSFGVIITQNVPRNNRLEKASDYWGSYLKKWIFWNHIRTIFCGTLLIIEVQGNKDISKIKIGKINIKLNKK